MIIKYLIKKTHKNEFFVFLKYKEYPYILKTSCFSIFLTFSCFLELGKSVDALVYTVAR